MLSLGLQTISTQIVRNMMKSLKSIQKIMMATEMVALSELRAIQTRAENPRGLWQPFTALLGDIPKHHGPPKVNFCEDLINSSKWKEEHSNRSPQNRGFAMLDVIGGELGEALNVGFHLSGQQCMSVYTTVVEGSNPRNVPQLVTSIHSSFMGSKASFMGNLNVFGKSGTLFCANHTRCYSSKQKRVMMDKRNIRDYKRRLLAEKYELKRMLYKAVLRDASLPYDLREKFRTKLSRLPRNSSFVRIRNRCIFTARPRAVYREFRMSRLVFRELACQGALTGIRKASW